MERRPLQVYLDERQIELLRDIAERRKTSMADIVRESIAQYFASLPLEDDPAMRIIGLGRSDVTDGPENHDYYVAEHVMAKFDGGGDSATGDRKAGRPPVKGGRR